jgi:hypothetical protein
MIPSASPKINIIIVRVPWSWEVLIIIYIVIYADLDAAMFSFESDTIRGTA